MEGLRDDRKHLGSDSQAERLSGEDLDVSTHAEAAVDVDDVSASGTSKWWAAVMGTTVAVASDGEEARRWTMLSLKRGLFDPTTSRPRLMVPARSADGHTSIDGW